MKKNVNGKEINVDIIGGFEVEELGKKYAVCSYDDDQTSDEQLVMIFEIENIDGTQNLISINSEEKELVLKFYNSYKQTLLRGDNNE